MIKERRANYKKTYNLRNKKENNEKAKQNYAENREERKEKAKKHHEKNKDVRNVKSKERREVVKIENKEYEKRVKKFKKETKDGPSFACQCCHRTLFYRGMNLRIVKINTFF